MGGWVVLVVLVLATVFGLYRAATDGRFRGTHRVRGAGDAAASDSAGAGATEGEGSGDAHSSPDAGPVEDALTPADLGAPLGERATLLQFSSAFCAPCRATRAVLADIASVVPGVVHVEVDAESHLALVRRLSVLRTPTTLVLDPQGREVSRAPGALRKQQVIAALGQAIPDDR